MTSKMLDDLPGLQDGGQVKLLTLRQCLNVKIPTQEDGGEVSMGSMEHTQKDFTCNRWTEIDPMEN